MQVVLYTTSRPCPLCEDARAHLERLRARHPFELRVVEIDADPRLSIRHALRVPVVEVDGREIGFGRIDPTALETAVRGQARVVPSP